MMQRRFACKWAALPLLVSLCSAASAGQAPKLRLSEVQGIAPTNYRTDLTLDPTKDSFAGVIAIKVDVRTAAQTIWLNASKIAVQEASISTGKKTLRAKALSGGDDFIGLQFESGIPAGPAEIKIHYTGVVRQGDPEGIFNAEDNGSHYLFTQFEPTDARDAFPCFDEPSYKVPWQLTLHVPAPNKAVSNTPVASESTAGDQTTYVFKETKPLPSYLVAFAVGPFDFVDAGVAGKNRFPVRIVVPKGAAEEAKFAAEVTPIILTRLEDYFGISFPYEKSDQVVVPASVGFGAMENAGMVTYTEEHILSKPATDSISRQREYSLVAAHELAHQWFGDLVTPAWWGDIWLNEAFAMWMTQKLIAEWKPEWKTSVSEDVDSKLYAEDRDSLASAREICRTIKTNDDIYSAFDSITYNKGAAVIGMFENWIGPETFRQRVRSYLTRYAHKNATTADFLASLGTVARKDVVQAFSTFLNQPGVPMVSLALDCAQKTRTLHVEQERFLSLGSKGPTKQIWNVPLCVRYGGPPECTLMTGTTMDWPLKGAQSCPTWLEGNADAKGYYLVNYKGPLLSSLTGSASRLGAAERFDLIGGVQMLAAGGKLPASDALSLVQIFHDDPECLIVQRALDVALSIREDLVPPSLVANYRRFILGNFQARAHELGWIHKPGESDDTLMLRPALVAAVAMYGGDPDLAKQGQDLADNWLAGRGGVSPDMLEAVLNTAAYYGGLDLFNRFLAAYKRTQDAQEKRHLLAAMENFHDPAAVEASFQAVLSKSVPILDDFSLLVSAGQRYPDTRKMAFEFVKTHTDVIITDLGMDPGWSLPRVGDSFCDADSRNELQSFFGPIVSKYASEPRTLSRTLESIDLCIARKAAQEPSVKAFLEKY